MKEKFNKEGKKSPQALNLEYKLNLLSNQQRYEEAAKVKAKLEKELF